MEGLLLRINKSIKKAYAYLCVLLVFFSCKDHKIDTKSKTFDFVVDLVIKKEDDAILYFRDGSNEWFDEKHAIWVHVIGTEKAQKVKFSLPEGVLPNHLRFDFSKNPKQDPVRILNIKVSYNNHSFEIKEDDVLKYFNCNECIIYDSATKTYKTIRDSKRVYDPYMLINEKFYYEMDNIIMGN